MNIDFSCPKEVFLEEEFECEILFDNNFLSYDVKLNLRGNETTINQIWNGNSWARSDWYVKELINGKKTFVRLRINKDFLGKSKGNLKIRFPKENKIIYEEEFEIEIKEFQTISKNISILSKKELVLNSKDIKTEKNVFLQDKNFLLYSGIVFLGIISGILYFIKTKNGRRKFKEDTFGNYY